MLDSNALNRLVTVIVPLLFAVTTHEFAHGYVANRLGDDTAKLAGRLSLNPLRHLHIIGSLLLPLILFLSGSPILFGYAKPIPVNAARFRNTNRDMTLVASAGIVANLGLAILSGGIFQILIRSQSFWHHTPVDPFLVDLANFAAYSVLINCILAVFNLIPVPPLDGSRIVYVLLPASLKAPYRRIERYGILIIFFLLITESLGRFTSLFIAPLASFLLGH